MRQKSHQRPPSLCAKLCSDILANVVRTKTDLILFRSRLLIFVLVLVLTTISRYVFVIFVITDEKHCTQPVRKLVPVISVGFFRARGERQ